MDLALVGEESIRLKGKNASIIIDPTNTIPKIEAEGIIALSKGDGFSDKKVEGSRIMIEGPGEYEVGGIKVSAIKVDGKLAVLVFVDNLKILFGSGLVIEKIKDRLDNCQIAVIKADSEFNYSMLPSLEPNVMVIYGPNKEEVQKSLGKEGAKATKYSTTAERLPQEMEFVVLG